MQNQIVGQVSGGFANVDAAFNSYAFGYNNSTAAPNFLTAGNMGSVSTVPGFTVSNNAADIIGVPSPGAIALVLIGTVVALRGRKRSNSR
ncbi:MAG: hypothetical protein EYC62_01535 [Alphaproteobacteria bacterium]|nr:MAG: hypothetical protein EYC62_01535 [Alphaproteobacteria bacterium]